jgi:hypothetical protein
MQDPGSPPAACPSCGALSHDGARFCPQCGVRLDGDGAHVAGGSTFHAARHTFGLAPPALVLVLAVIAFVLAVVLFALGHWIAGLVLVVLAAGLARFFVWTARQLPEQRVAQLAVAASNAASGHAGFARVSVSSWWSAGWDVLRLRTLQRRLAREQAGLIRALGEAVFRDDTERAEQLKAQAQACGERIAEHESELRHALDAARERVSRERVAIQPTELLAHDQAQTVAAAAPQPDE